MSKPTIAELEAEQAAIEAQRARLAEQIERQRAGDLRAGQQERQEALRVAEAEAIRLADEIEAQKAAALRVDQLDKIAALRAAYPAMRAAQRASCKAAREWLAAGPAIAKAYADDLTALNAAQYDMRILAGALEMPVQFESGEDNLGGSGALLAMIDRDIKAQFKRI